MKRKRWTTPRQLPSANLYPDDLQDPTDFFRKSPTPKHDRKLQQLCRQVHHALSLGLSEAGGDEWLQGLVVEDVLPAPNAGRLLVRLSLAPSIQHLLSAQDRHAVMADILERLERVSPRLRHEVASAITRKYAPQLAFQIVPPGEVSP